MAYVALTSSLRSLNWVLDVLESNRYLQLGAMQVWALRPKLKLLQVFLEEHVAPKSLEGKIRDVVYQVEDFMDELWQVLYKTSLTLSRIVEEVDSVNEDVLTVYEDIIKEIDSSLLEDIIQQLGQPMGLSSKVNVLQTLLRDCIYKLESSHVEKIDSVVSRAEGSLNCMRPISYASKLRLTEVIGDVDSVNEHMVRFCKNISGPVKEDPNSSSSSLQSRDSEIDFEAETMNIKELLLGPSKRLEIIEFETQFSKESIARRVLNNPFIRNHFVHCGWARGSRIHQATNLSIADLIEDYLPDHKYPISAIIRSVLNRCFNGSKYLIIIDSPFSMEALTCIRESFPDDQNGSRILLLAGDTVIKREFLLPPELIYIRDETQRKSHGIYPDFVAKARHLMQIVEVEGLYFAQEGIADFFDSEIIRRLSNLGSIAKNYGKQYDKMLQQSNLLDSLLDMLLSEKSKYFMDLTKSLESESYSSQCQFLQIQENISDVVLDQVYWTLPHRLKVCFLYMAAFPEDLEIGARKLFMLWISEGFLESEGSKSMEEVAEEHLNELNNRHLIIVGKRRSDNGIKTCRLPATLRQFCLGAAREENFLQVIDKSNQKFTMGRDSKRRLSFHSDKFDDVHLLPPMPSTRSFLFFGVASSIVPDIFFFNIDFKLLKVLDIAFLRFDDFPQQIVELIHLRYLALTATFNLPASISKLLNLQILIVHGPWISNNDKESSFLPTEIWDLKRLRYLCFSISSYFPAPVKDSDMLYLHTLCNIRPTSCTKHFISCVPNVRRIAICETQEDYEVHWGVPSVCLANLLHLQCLETLKYSSCLRQAKGRCVPYSYSFPLSLKKLTLSGCYLPWSCISLLSSLPKLEVLKLRNYAFQGAEWEASVGGFLHLKSLRVEETNLVHWKASRMSFPRLEQLVLVSCNSLLEIPGDISEIPNLKLIDLQFCSPSSETSARNLQEERKAAGKECVDICIQPSRLKTDSVDKL